MVYTRWHQQHCKCQLSKAGMRADPCQQIYLRCKVHILMIQVQNNFQVSSVCTYLSLQMTKVPKGILGTVEN